MRAALRLIAAMGRAGVPFERIEAHIEYSDFTDDEKALLWLFAWCDGCPHELREIMLERTA
jgi:hypothetical protein